ncbi:MAG: dihydroorotase [Pseudomonadota bacterium]|nr:dihydroorotase [Pseudomonadota bacterium]MEC8531324.1 dihydroorotase [Pseudomonadota bacterium]
MTDRTAYINARVLDPATETDRVGSVLVSGNKIVEWGTGLFEDGIPENVRIVDCHGYCLAPGLIDMRVHLPEPGGEHKESFETASAAAAGGGVTSIVCLPDAQTPIDNISVLEFIARRARETNIVKIYAYGTITRNRAGNELSEFGILAEAGALAFTDGDKALADALVMRRALSYAATFNFLIIQHPEEPRLALNGQMNEGEMATRLGLAGIPAAAEVMMIERDLRLVEMTGARYHAAHISTAASVNAIRNAKTRGLPVTCDTAPHYFTLTDSSVMDYRTFTKVSPPLRDEKDRLAIVEGVLDGTIDMIGSDHRPQDQDSKRLPFLQAETGIVGLETLLPLTLALHHVENVPLIDLIRRLTAAPANLLGMKEGRLGIGLPADFTIFDPNHNWTIKADNLRSKSKNTPFDGHTVKGMAMCTVVGGRHVHSLID